ncbi:unnamed protein product [Penicillium salamii]|uniref:Uncharacterized protein n=1 Tax=Penicillium salamii TaxID=1612424 RepID=A0A9W4NUE9_9EURO|nr:unnamed protein product [Penicillium salamii]CAG8180224.1 unnamed protein product [Penicillium salamii]CAG8215488.1 unnamed protein product [Penicillium salamii]CAG8246546.1 unnamed protein product [Penicillium salamii]CAG8272266.1 unnamed protein product [Penicillium salamii]
MACRSGQDPEDWLQHLARWRSECQRSIQREEQIASGVPIQPGDDYVLSGSRSLPLLQNWPIETPPLWSLKHNDSAASDSRRTWKPKRVRLSDAGVVYALLALPQYYRTQFLSFDFDANGDVRRDRIPKSPTVIVYQNGLPTLLTWKGVYILTGGYNDAGWLLADAYPNCDPFFQSGLVFPAIDIETCDELSTQLTRYHPMPTSGPEKSTGLWGYGGWSMGILLRGCDDIDAHCLVLEGKVLSGYQKLGSLFGFQTLISSNADPSDRNQAIQRNMPAESTLDIYHRIDWASIPVQSLKHGDPVAKIGHGSDNNVKLPVRSRDAKRKREIDSEEYRDVVAARHVSLLAARGEAPLPTQDHLDTSLSTPDTFQILWRQLKEVETTPQRLDLFTAIVALEDLYQRWGWNEIAAKIVRNKFSQSEAAALSNMACCLPPRVSWSMLGFDMNRDAVAIQHAFSYNTARSEFACKVDDLEEGPVKRVYKSFSSYFGRLTTPEATEQVYHLNIRSSESPRNVQPEQSEQIIRSPEIPPCHSHDNEPHCLQPGIALCEYMDSIKEYEHYYRENKAIGKFHEQMTAFLEQLDHNRPKTPIYE